MTTQQYDAIIIGSGQAAGPLWGALVKAGHKTALIERVHVGGCCVNEGCTPTKTMIASGRVAYLAKRAADYGVHTDEVAIDMKKIRQRKRAIVEQFRASGERGLEKDQRVDLLMGEAHFTSPKSVEVSMNDGGTQNLTSDLIFINTGARPSIPHLPGLDTVPYLDSTSIMELGDVPEHLLVMGGGYIGLEFGQLFRRLGAEVTIVQRGKQLAGREDADMADEIAKILREDGLEILLETDAIRVSKDGGKIALTVRTPRGERILTGSHLLVAAGRMPNTEALNLPAAGIKADKHGYVVVNERLETNVPGIYALGDVKGGPAFTHISYDDFRIIRANLLQGGNCTVNDRPVPYTMFIDPQFGRVGLSEQEAKEQGIPYKVAKMPMSYVARALEVDETRGLIKVLIAPDSKQILGCAILGLEGGEIMSMLQIAMMGKLPYTELENAVFAHPLLAESLNNVFGYIE